MEVFWLANQPPINGHTGIHRKEMTLEDGDVYRKIHLWVAKTDIKQHYLDAYTCPKILTATEKTQLRDADIVIARGEVAREARARGMRVVDGPNPIFWALREAISMQQSH